MLDKLKNLNLFWVVDPRTKEISVSLTLLMITFLGSIVACGLEMAGKIESTSSIVELFYATTALYFGRRMSFGGKAFSSDAAPEEKKE